MIIIITRMLPLIDQLGFSLENIVNTASIHINGDEHAKIKTIEDTKKKYFKKVSRFLYRVMSVNHLSPETLYTFNISPDKKLIWAVMLHEKKFTGEVHRVPKIIQKNINKAINGKSSKSELYKDQHGTWISAYAPITNKEGEVVGILEADYKADVFINRLRAHMFDIIIKISLILSLALLIAILLIVRIFKPIKELVEAAKSIEQGEYNIQISVNRKDEFGTLQHMFIRMSSKLKERFYMLKYISQHTIDMIKKVHTHELHEEGELRTVVIFFSDIRGFTKYSSVRTPEVIIAMLNIILGVQSDIISKYNGHIDKFVGDEVVATFEGEHSVKNALLSAIEIHQAIQKLSDDKVLDSNLTVGIGISKGEVVFGNIGSSERKDFTMIGSEVNLTSRLCSYAKGGEIIISAIVLFYLRQSILSKEYTAIDHGKATLKGFPDPIPVYLIVKKDNLPV